MRLKLARISTMPASESKMVFTSCFLSFMILFWHPATIQAVPSIKSYEYEYDYDPSKPSETFFMPSSFS